MKVELKLDENVEETKIVVYAKELNEDITTLINKLNIEDTEILIGLIDNTTYILDKDKIETFYAENNKVYARIDDKIYRIKKKLYELEEMLQGTKFIRISNSEIVNFNKVESLSFDGSTSIILKFQSNKITYVSRRYVSKIKEYLKI